jgi:hypothetical protein
MFSTNSIADLSYNLCQAFWTPGLPLLARNTPESVRAKQEYISGDITEDEYQARVMLQRNKLSNYAFGAMSTGYTLTLIIALGAAFGLHANDSTHNNIRAAVVIVGIATGVWIVFGTPWFFIEKNRSNKLEVPLPAGSGKQSTFAEAKQYIVTGLKVYWNVLKHIPHLTQTWLYLVGFFLISDGFATTNQIYGIAQNTIVSYSTTTSTELYIVQGFSNLVGIAVFWLIQRHFRIRTKTILIVNCIFVILNAVWGMSSPSLPIGHFSLMNTDNDDRLHRYRNDQIWSPQHMGSMGLLRLQLRICRPLHGLYGNYAQRSLPQGPRSHILLPILTCQ